jgi:thymidylate synthase ThyX
MISARIERDSVAPNGVRLTTFVLTYPRFIHSELMTHRAFSRNAASSRAIPFKRMLEMVKENPAMPVHWGSAKPGMQSGAEVEDVPRVKKIWLNAMEDAIYRAKQLDDLHVHKSISNRLLEPFAHMVTLVTATDWHNFFHLRAHKAAMPEFQALAYAMLELYLREKPTPVPEDNWHLPFVTAKDVLDAYERAEFKVNDAIKQLCEISTARSARISYLLFKDTTPEQDIKLHGDLEGNGHWSPFEHIATPMKHHRSEEQYCGNFRGWNQYRKQFPNENMANVDLPAILAAR